MEILVEGRNLTKQFGERYLVIGIDVSQNTLDMAFWEYDEPVFQGKFPNSKKDFDVIAQRIEVRSQETKSTSVFIIMEPTGGYEQPFTRFAMQKEWQVSLPNPRRVKQWAQAMGIRTKTDKHDAKTLAHYGFMQKPSRPEEAVIAVDDVSMSINQGELLVIMGESGSGKTTLISVLGCILQPTSGSLIIDGSEVDYESQDLSEIRTKKVGFVFQLFNLIPYLTALENVMIAMDIGGIKGPEAEEKARELLTQVGLLERLDHRPSQLSGGEQQRVSFARALANDPLIVFADEPTANLDSKNSASIMELIESLCRERNIAFAVVTHDAHLRENADRIIEMEDGRVLDA